MNLSIIILAGVGATVALLCLLGIVVVSVNAFLDWRKEPHARSFYEGIEHERNRLRNDAWWFSESSETMQLITDLSKGQNPGDAREKWRKARELNITNPAGGA